MYLVEKHVQLCDIWFKLLWYEIDKSWLRLRSPTNIESYLFHLHIHIGPTKRSKHNQYSAGGENEYFAMMLRHSKTVKKESSTKVKVKDFENKLAPFIFDEIITSQINKQLHAYVRFWSCDRKKNSTRFCGSIFIHFSGEL